MYQRLFSRFLKKSFPPDPGPPKTRFHPDSTVPDTPVRFGYKCNWLAVRTTDTERLAASFGLRNTAPCNWEYGLISAYDLNGLIFISPPVVGWSFIISRNLPYAENPQSVKLLKSILTDLSKEFSYAQYFGTLRTVGYDCWMRAEDGQITRAYAVADGTTTIVEGTPTSFEQNYQLYNTLSEEYENDPDYLERPDLVHPDESMTMEVAGAWSLNPQDLEELKDVAPALGLVGTLHTEAM